MFQKIKREFKLLVCKLKKKDPMEMLLNDYRKKGAIIGRGVRAFSPITSSEPYLITVGNNVTVSSEVQFLTHDNSATKIHENKSDYIGSITIGDNCFIGARVILLPGIRLAPNTIVGAGSVVTKSVIESGLIVAGNPAKVIGSVLEVREKRAENAFQLRGKSFVEKKEIILKNQSKWIVR